ncbi:MAG: 30S ribosomal protein S18 [Candidatus Aegiribacteria sp.]|nr:30S ribosomal protein S18 [Candidatus Aegiribacteria sp.]
MKKKNSKFGRKKKCRFCVNPQMEISFKNERMLQRYVSDRGKIVARRVTGNCAKHQRRVANAIKVARFLALVPYVREHYR